MHALVAFAIGPIGRYVLIAVAAIGVLLWVVTGIRDNAVQAERLRVERANAETQRAADEAQRDVLTCIGNWNRETGKCEEK